MRFTETLFCVRSLLFLRSFFFLSFTLAHSRRHSHSLTTNGKTTGAYTHTHNHSNAQWDTNTHTHRHSERHIYNGNKARVNKNKKLILAFPQVFHFSDWFHVSSSALLLASSSSRTAHWHTQAYFLTFFLCAFARFSCSASASSSTLVRLVLLALLFSFWPIPLLPVFPVPLPLPLPSSSTSTSRFSHTIKTSNLKIFGYFWVWKFFCCFC